MGLGGFFSSGGNQQTSDSFSGLRAKDNMGAFNALLNRTPGDYDYLFTNLRDRAQNNNILGLNAEGFMPGQLAGVNKLGSQLFGNVSSNYARMGLNRPENINAVVGGALTQAAPQLMALSGQNVMANQALQSDRFAQLLSLFGQVPGMLGSESHSTGMAAGPGIGYQGASNLFNNFLNGSMGTSVGSALGGVLF